MDLGHAGHLPPDVYPKRCGALLHPDHLALERPAHESHPFDAHLGALMIDVSWPCGEKKRRDQR